MSAVRIKRVCMTDKRTIAASKNGKRKGGNRKGEDRNRDVQSKTHGGNDRRTNSNNSGQGRHSDPAGQRVARDRRAVGLVKNQDRGSGNNRSERDRMVAKSPRRDRHQQSSRFPGHQPAKKTLVWDTNSSFDNNPFENAQLPPARMIEMPMNALDFGGGVQPGSYLVVLPAADTTQFQAAQQAAQLSIVNPAILSTGQGMESHFPSQAPAPSSLGVLESRRFEEPSRMDFKVNDGYQGLGSGRPPPGRSDDRSYSSNIMEYTGLPVGEDAILRVPYCRACKEYIAREKDVEAHLRGEGHFRKYLSIQTGGERSAAVHEKVQQTTDESRQKERMHSDSPVETRRHHATSSHYEYEDMRRKSVRRDPSPPPFHSSSSNRAVLEEAHGSQSHGQGQTLRRSSRDRSSPSSRWPQWEEDTLNRQLDTMDRRGVNTMDRRVDTMDRKLDRYQVSDRSESRANTSISFSSNNNTKTNSEDWNSRGRNERGDYGQFETATRSRGYDSSEDSTATFRCRMCGLGGIHDLSKHMRTIHFEDVVLRR